MQLGDAFLCFYITIPNLPKTTYHGRLVGVFKTLVSQNHFGKQKGWLPKLTKKSKNGKFNIKYIISFLHSLIVIESLGKLILLTDHQQRQPAPLNPTSLLTPRMPEIPCPWCPLITHNIQICDVLVDMRNKNLTRVVIDKANPANDIPEVREALRHLALIARMNDKLKVGYASEIDNSSVYMIVEHKLKNVYKVCFHNRGATDCPDCPGHTKCC